MKHIALLACLASPAFADPVTIADIHAARMGDTWRFDVTLLHPDDGWDHYTDAWQVEDAEGNVFYRNSDDSRRWVIYNGENEATRVGPEWHGWLHHTWDDAPTEVEIIHKPWEKSHQENLTGTAAAYAPAGSIRNAAPATRRDYEAWTPE